jgi:hypothetical protein
MKKTAVNAAMSALILTITACGAAGKPAQHLAATSIENLGCKASQSEMWTALHRIAEEGGAYPEAEGLREALITAGGTRQLKGEAFERYVDAFVSNYSLTIEGIKEKLNPVDVSGWKKALAEMEVGVRVTSVHAELQDKLQASLKNLDSQEALLKQDCATGDGTVSLPTPVAPTPVAPTPVAPNPVETKPGSIWEQLEKEGPEVVGARRSLATAYQSCDVLSLPAMTTATPAVDGITVLAEPHPAGGRKRVYGSIANINSSHYYIKNQRLAKNSCFEVRKAPPIYDFGGKPATSAADTKLLNFFKSSGSGTSVLGIDCSAFVFSALAVSGLKMDPDPKKILKADLVHGIGSRAFKEPQSNGLRCLAKIAVTKNASIKAGDVVAINGHVVMVDHVGDDPFGLKKISSIADCRAEKLPSSDFDFVLAQSSPSKSGIGINRFQARDYLKESSTYKDGLTKYAVAACKAKFGTITAVDTKNLSVTRHKKTAECRTEALRITNQDCVDSCRAI